MQFESQPLCTARLNCGVLRSLVGTSFLIWYFVFTWHAHTHIQKRIKFDYLKWNFMNTAFMYSIHCIRLLIYSNSHLPTTARFCSPKIQNVSTILSILPFLAHSLPIHHFVQNEIIIRKTNLKATLTFSIALNGGKPDVPWIRLIIEISNSISHLRLVFDAIVTFQMMMATNGPLVEFRALLC